MIQDSGTRREFESGAVRDIAKGKGRCDLLPLGEVGLIMGDAHLDSIGKYLYTGDRIRIIDVIWEFSVGAYGNIPTAMLEVSKHFEEGAIKYAERNWEKGIPCHCYVDSAVRHYLKFERGDEDEDHGRAFLWNLLCLLWTVDNKPEFNDLPYVNNLQEKKDVIR